jgi:hypothetical protein
MRIHPCALCGAGQRVPDGSDAEYEIVTGGTFGVRVICAPCLERLFGERINGRVSRPRAVREALAERYGSSTAWTSTDSLGGLLEEARTYLSSREARSGMDFGTWQKLVDLGLSS